MNTPVYCLLNSDGSPSNIHVKADKRQPGKSYARVVYGDMSPTYDVLSEYLIPSRVLQDDGTVLFSYTVASLPLDSVKQSKLAALQEEYDQLLKDGYADPVSGRTLAWKDADRNAFMGEFMNLQYGIAAGTIQPTDPALISDINKLPITGLTVQQVMGILVAYGQAYKTQWARIALANEAIQNAEDVDSVLAVTL
jgi:hypothetical protein